MKLKVFSWTILFALFGIFPAAAQDTSSPILDSANIRQLQSVAHIDFTDLPEEAGIVDKGWFATTSSGRYFAFISRDNAVTLWDFETGYLNTTVASCGESQEAGGFIDGSFEPLLEDTFYGVYLSGETSYVGYHRLDGKNQPMAYCYLTGIPIRTWVSPIAQNWIEMFPKDPLDKPYVEYLPALTLLLTDENIEILPQQKPSGPENDTDSFMRIGRIDPPLAITATKDALLKRWNLETGEVTATTQLDSLPAAGQVNADGTFFTWVDQKFESLHLLNFEMGEDQVIAPLGGTYIPFLLLSAKADVIIGVNVGLEPRISAWDVLTGERINLGEYRTCNRQPDMVRLSKDGSTLVIGCDTGLDIWRVPEIS